MTKFNVHYINPVGERSVAEITAETLCTIGV